VTCHRCQNEAFKFGFHKGFQRCRCRACKRTFSDIPERPLDNKRVDPAKAYQVVRLLVEGVLGIRAIERLTGLNRRTVLGVLDVAGEKCERLMDAKVRNVKADHVQADEMYAFVGCKQQNVKFDGMERGEYYTYLAVDRASKLIITFQTGRRDVDNTAAFLLDLKFRVQPGFQITTDAFQQYCGGGASVRAIFGESVHCATERKFFAGLQPYAPRQLIGVHRKRMIGEPDMKMATTCHVERTNLNVRLFNRRFTRLTLGYSKKIHNHCRAVALFVAFANFCRVHHSLAGKTPAMAAGLTDRVWTVADLFKP
jgi:transposase-like protein/IS1 family transposase